MRAGPQRGTAWLCFGGISEGFQGKAGVTGCQAQHCKRMHLKLSWSSVGVSKSQSWEEKVGICILMGGVTFLKHEEFFD